MKIFLIFALLLNLNTFGFCYKRMWFLSDSDRIEIALKDVFHFYDNDPSYGLIDSVFLNGENTLSGQKYQQIPYANIKDFLKQNPNCCEVTRVIKVSEGILRIGIWDCLSGLSPYFVSGEYKVNIKLNGQIETVYKAFNYKMSSCGTLYGVFD